MYRAQLPSLAPFLPHRSTHCRVTRRVPIFWGLRMAQDVAGSGAGTGSATALPASYSNYLSYRRFDFHAARPS